MHGHRVSPMDGWSITEDQVVSHLRHQKQENFEALHQQRDIHGEQEQRDHQKEFPCFCIILWHLSFLRS